LNLSNDERFDFTLEINDYLLKQETSSMIDQNLILNAFILSYQLENTFVLFVNNPEDEMSIWNDLLSQLKDINEENAIHGLTKFNNIFLFSNAYLRN
jgi:hypothetical protein